MSDFALFTDGACDLPVQYCKEEHITVVPLYYTLSSATTYCYPEQDSEFDAKEFYQMLRSGIQSKTAAPSIEDFISYMRPVLEQGKDVLYLAFSAKLSGTFNVARLAADELSEEFPDRKILILNTRCVSLGQGLLVMQVAEKIKTGCTLEEAFLFAENLSLRIQHLCVMDDLMFLKRGGRISSSTAFVGSVLQIKPMLRTNTEGELEVFSKSRGRKNAVKQLADIVGKNTLPNTTVCISHADSMEDAVFIRDILRRVYNIRSIIIQDIGPVLGSHSGPATVAAFSIIPSSTGGEPPQVS